jgi:hypothetical protein
MNLKRINLIVELEYRTGVSREYVEYYDYDDFIYVYIQ